MRHPLCLAALLSLLAQSALAQPALATPPPQPAGLTDDHRAALQCAATFAVVATEQARGEEAALAFPMLAVRGKRYFAAVGDKVVGEAGLTKEQVRDILTADVAALQARAGTDPDGALRTAMKPCLARLEAEVPPLKEPTLLQCSAILSLAYDEVHAREGLSPAAQDMKTLASVLAARQHEALVAGGKSGDEADAALALAHDAMLKEAFDGAGGIEKYDIAHCYDLAKPAAKSHY